MGSFCCRSALQFQKGIGFSLHVVKKGSPEEERRGRDIPNTFQMHRPNLNHLFLLLRLEDSVSATSSHADYIEELGAVDHMVVYSSIAIS